MLEGQVLGKAIAKNTAKVNMEKAVENTSQCGHNIAPQNDSMLYFDN